MKVLIRCNYCGKTVPYYGKLYKALQLKGAKCRGGWYYDDNYRYCSEECAENQMKKGGVRKWIIGTTD